MSAIERQFALARRVFKAHGGMVRTTQLVEAGVWPRTLYALRDAGHVQALARGVFRLIEMKPLVDPPLSKVAEGVTGGVICLRSALAFHELSEEVPQQVDLAIGMKDRRPTLSYPPLRVFHYPDKLLEAGVRVHSIDGVKVRIFGPEKTIVDCYKYRLRFHIDLTLDAIRAYCKRPRRNFDLIMKFAKLARVHRLLRPYLEAISISPESEFWRGKVVRS